MDEDNPHHSFHGILYKSNNKEKMHFRLNRFAIILLKTLKHVLTIHFDLTKFIVSIL